MEHYPFSRRSFLAIGVFGTLVIVTLRGDTIELKTGERLDGSFRQASAIGVVFEVADQAMTIPLAKVQAIYFGTEKPAAISTGPKPYAEALEALRALRSVTESGVTFRDYAPRVLDAKVKVDRYLASSADTTPARGAIDAAMRAHQVAAKAWSANISNNALAELTVGENILSDSEISNCPTVKKIINQASSMGRQRGAASPAIAVGVLVAMSPSALWACADLNLSEAEKMLMPSNAPQTAGGHATTPVNAKSGGPIPSVDNEAKQIIVIRFSSLPADADVSIDGQSRGYTPTMDFTDVSSGPHKLAMKKPGYQLWEQVITFAPGDNRTISVELTPEPIDPTKPRIVGN
jgi:hypothetical protein